MPDAVLWLCPSLPTETFKWLSSLPILMQESFWWWQCSDRYIMSFFPHLHSPFSPSLISLMVSVDVKHHVYLLTLSLPVWRHNLWRPWRSVFHSPKRRHGTPCSNSGCSSMLTRGQVLGKWLFLSSLTRLHGPFGKRSKLLHAFSGWERVKQTELCFAFARNQRRGQYLLFFFEDLSAWNKTPHF